jgi:TolB-like protein
VSTETKARNPTKPSLNTPKAQATEPEWVEKRHPTQKSRISKPYWIVAAAAIALLATLGFILTAAPSVSNGAAPVPPPADMAVVVMPFDGLGSDHTAQWTGRGLTELLTTELVWLEAFNITTRPPAARYSYPPPTPRQIARDLGVRYIVEGAVLATNSGLMVVARLIDAESEAYLWRSQYVAQGDDLLLFLKDTAGSIASAVFDALSPEGATQNQEVAR